MRRSRDFYAGSSELIGQKISTEHSPGPKVTVPGTTVEKISSLGKGKDTGGIMERCSLF